MYRLEKHLETEKRGYDRVFLMIYEKRIINEEIEKRRSLRNLNELGFFGIIIRREDIITAFSICEEQNKDNSNRSFTKADANIPGDIRLLTEKLAALN